MSESKWAEETFIIESADDIPKIINEYNLQVGDLLYFNFGGTKDAKDINHAVIITEIDENEIYYSGNTVFAYNEPLSGKIRNGNMHGVKLKDNIVVEEWIYVPGYHH